MRKVGGCDIAICGLLLDSGPVGYSLHTQDDIHMCRCICLLVCVDYSLEDSTAQRLVEENDGNTAVLLHAC
jgi:hypothetical protein